MRTLVPSGILSSTDKNRIPTMPWTHPNPNTFALIGSFLRNRLKEGRMVIETLDCGMLYYDTNCVAWIFGRYQISDHNTPQIEVRRGVSYRRRRGWLSLLPLREKRVMARYRICCIS